MDTEQTKNFCCGDTFHTQCGIQFVFFFPMTQDITTFQDIPRTTRQRIKLTSQARYDN